jgi:elongation factor G
MRAIVYGDDLGKDEEFIEIPADMLEKAQEYRQFYLKQLLKATTN